MRALLFSTLAVCTLLSAPSQSFARSGLVLASWNLEHLAETNGAGCRPRKDADYAALKTVAERLDADIVALQEVENAAAVARVFEPSVYAILVSSRADQALGNCRGRRGQARTAQRTAFAINRSRLAALHLRWRALPPFREIGIDGRRWGTRIMVEPLGDAAGSDRDRLEIVSLHLKSGCAWGGLDVGDVGRAQCLALRHQRGLLEEWVDGRAASNTPFALIGDFNRQLDQPDDDFWGAINDGEVCIWRKDAALGRSCVPGTDVSDPDADLTLANAGVPFAYPYNPKYPYAVDHFVFGGRAALWVIRGSYQAVDYPNDPSLSDHHPIRLEMRMPWASPARP
ncbi:MAG: endonuclease/exonuclease/phosphatase family protein [Thiohalocapsa sp.]